MKQITLTILLLAVSFGLFAQREVRKDIRQGNKSYNEQLYNAAEASYKEALTKNASSKEAIYNLANTYYKQGNIDEALKTYQQYLAAENTDPAKMSNAWHNIGNSFLRKKGHWQFYQITI